MLSNAYFLAKFRFDTAENEPAKNLQIFEKISCKNLPTFLKFSTQQPAGLLAPPPDAKVDLAEGPFPDFLLRFVFPVHAAAEEARACVCWHQLSSRIARLSAEKSK